MAKLKVQPKKEIEALWKELPRRRKEEREKNVLLERFGLKGEKKSLQAIGNRYGITRERVRQIQNQGIKSLRKVAKGKKIFRKIAKIVEKRGGLITLETATKLFLPKNATEQHKRWLHLFLVANPYLHYFKETASNYPFFTRGISQKTISQRFKNLIKLFKKAGQGLPLRKVASRLRLKPSLIKELCLAHKQLGVREGKVGLMSFPEINPKTTEAKIDLIFNKYRRPLHFTEIARLIRKEKLGNRQPTTPTVHNELIKHREKYVLVGRGVYALKKWGYLEGTVKEVIAQILKRANKKLTKEELIQEVLKQRQVKRNTILLNLAPFKHQLKS